MNATNLLFPRKSFDPCPSPKPRSHSCRRPHLEIRPTCSPADGVNDACIRPASTHVLQVSYHRDHVYLFDATGARRNGSAMSDPALSSYFMPSLPPPLPPPPGTPECSSKAGSSGGGGMGNGGDEGGVARSRGFEEPADGILEAHRALSAWDGRGGACGFASRSWMRVFFTVDALTW